MTTLDGSVRQYDNLTHCSPWSLPRRQLGATELLVTPIGFGAFKIGRNQGIKYPEDYALPTLDESTRLLNEMVDLGINLIDTAPAYGCSEQRIGEALSHRRRELVLSTKVGETFEDGRSTYDYSRSAILSSVERSLQRLRTDTLDLLWIHSNGQDLDILNHSDAVPTLRELREQRVVRAIGLSGKTVDGAREALQWADALMVEYHVNDGSHAEVLEEARNRSVGVVVKKGLAAGHLPAVDAVRFVLNNSSVDSVIIGTLNRDHMRDNLRTAIACRDGHFA